MPKITVANLTTAASRSRLAPRAEPYWMALDDIFGAYVGFRSGPNTWVARFRQGGRQVYRSLGKFDDHRQAARAAREWVKQTEKGVAPKGVTVGTACDRYLTALAAKRTPQAAQEARSRLQRCVLGRTFKTRRIEPHRLATVLLDKLRASDVTDWHLSRVPPGLKGQDLRKAQASANRELNTLKAALNFAYKQDLTSTNPWVKVEPFNDVQARQHRKPLSLEERRRWLKHATGGLRDLLEGLMLTGARPVELTRATVGDYNATAGTLALRSYKGRGREARVRAIPLKPLNALPLIKRLAKGKRPDDPLFTRDDGRPWGHSDWDDLVRESRDAAGLDGATAYSLRHSFITDAVTSGVDLLTVARIVGTGLPQIEKTYGHYQAAHAENVLSRMSSV
ncbi:MAG: tyrosine-type recombinase/integrase [Bradyrhizobium sp.]|uniref:tyrosine-type recombinase/integrase n=1 Tax=Bradyrhizobium sp. TaxID=376 RepID=UPI003D132DFE